MKEDKEKLEKFNRKLNKTWKNQTCPICKNKDFITLDRIFELREFNGGNLILGGENQVYPIIPVVCNKCGYTILFNYFVAKNLFKKLKNGK